MNKLVMMNNDAWILNDGINDGTSKVVLDFENGVHDDCNRGLYKRILFCQSLLLHLATVTLIRACLNE